MTIRGIGRAWQTARWLRNQFATTAMVLLYHRVTESPSDPQLLCVTPQRFAEHLEVLRRDYCPMRLSHLIAALRNGNLPSRAVAVTFDDGYADNLYEAKPLLERYEVPATVFVTTGYLGRKREFWWDELERVFLQPGNLSSALCLTIHGTAFQWDLTTATHYSKADYECHRGWNVSIKHDPTPRHTIYRALQRLLRPLSDCDRGKILDQLLIWAGGEARVRSNHRVMSSEEVIALADGGAVEVGAHTVTHPVLSTLPLPAQEVEIRESKDRLETLLGHAVTSFSYPYGARLDYLRRTTELVKDAGFMCACANFADLVWRGSDNYQLPRFLVRNWSGDDLARELSRWGRG